MTSPPLARAPTRLAWSLLALAGACAPSGDAPTPAVARQALARNLLWISLDTLRADRLGCYGYERPTSPTLDALALEGVVFEDASSPAPWTMPAHASLFTGLYPQRTGVVGFETAMYAEVRHVAERLREHGFSTQAVVSNTALTMHGLNRGFERFQFVDRGHGPEPSRVTPLAIRQLEGRDPERPFFALVHYNAVHAPYRSLPRHERQFVRPYDGEITGRNAEFLAHATGARRFTEEDVQHLSDLYDAAIKQLDGQLEKLFEYVRAEGLLEDTLVVITSDHGEEFFDHGEVNHAMTQYQELVRVPLILLGPGVPAGARVATPVSLVDLMPTSFAYLGLPLPPDLDGVDIRGTWLASMEEPVERLLYFEADCAPPDAKGVLVPGSKRAIRDERYKLHYDQRTEETALYDLRADPTELRDVQAEHGDLVARLLGDLAAFLATAPDPLDAPLTEDQLRRLEELGYVQTEE